MAVVKNLMVRAGADFSQMRTEMQKAQRDTKSFQQNVGKSLDRMRDDMKQADQAAGNFRRGLRASLVGIATAIGTLGIGNLVKDAVKSAMEVEAAMGQINRMMGESAQSFVDWAKTGAKSYNLATSDAIKYGAVYANLISNFAKGTAETAKFTQELLKASAVISSKTGRAMDDVMDRIRSGLLGETDAIEDLGINVNIALIKSTEAFKRFANGQSWEKLGYNTQQLILYFGILEQASRKYGVELADNTNTRQMAFVAQLKDLRWSLGQAFLPIYNAVLPALSQMATALSDVMNVIAQFTTALFGKAKTSTEAQTDATAAQAGAVGDLGDAYKEAGKKARGAVAGFDEVNQLADADGSAGSGSSPSGTPKKPSNDDIMGIGDAAVQVSKKIQEMADKVKEFFQNFLSPEQKKRIRDALDDLKDSWDGLKSAIASFMDNPKVQKAAQGFKDWWTENGVNNLTNALQSLKGILDIVSGALKTIDGLLSGDWQRAWSGAKTIVSGLYDTAAGLVGILFPKLGEKMDEFKEHFSTLWPDTKRVVMEKWDDLKKSTGEKWDVIKEYIGEKWNLIKGYVQWDNVKSTLMGKWDTLKLETGLKWDGIKTYIGEKWNLIKGYVQWDNVKTAVNSMWDRLKIETGDKIAGIKEWISTKWNLIKDFVKWDNVKTAVSNMWSNVKEETGEWFDTVYKVLVGDKWNALAKIDFSQVWPAIKEAWEFIATKTGSIWDGIAEAIKDTMNTVIRSINNAIAKINALKIEIPSVGIGKAKTPAMTIGLPHIPNIPELATGGITNGPMTAIIGDNPGGREVVSPLDDLMDMIQSAVGSAVMAASQLNGGRQGDTVVQLDGVTLARVLGPYSQRESSRVGGSMINTAGAARIVTT